MNSTALSIQHSYSIYAGDFHLHTLGDSGPFQNPAFAAGYEHSALRSIVAQSVSPAYLERLLLGASRRVQSHIRTNTDNGDVAARFTGIVGLGDYTDMACSQERDMLLTSAAHLAGIDPNITFTMMVPGNHDGGQYMGSLWSKDNLFGLPFVGGNDLRQGACGCGRALSVEERIETLRQITGFGTDAESVTAVSRMLGNGFDTPHGRTYSFDHPREVFDLVWKQLPGEERWEAVIHYGSNA
ncbi:MAG TPA: hypothetical protein VJC18_12055, partial [bacterium]|nr:hypothetical protein [bacterium]